MVTEIELSPRVTQSQKHGHLPAFAHSACAYLFSPLSPEASHLPGVHCSPLCFCVSTPVWVGL